MPRLLKKLEDYARMGIATIVVVDPVSKVISRYVDGELVAIAEPVLALPGSVCTIDWRRVEELLD